MLRRLAWAIGLVLLATLLGHAQTPGVAVTATLVDGQGNIQKTGYLHFELWNCGGNVPQVVGNPYALVQQQFDMRPNPATGIVSGSIYGRNQLLCGNVTSTQWLVTLYKSSGQIGIRPQYYCLDSPGTFDPSSTQPCQVTPPPPGFQLLFANPIQSQTWKQPTGTTGFFVGAFDFSQATVTGLNTGGSGGGNGPAISVNGIPLGSTVAAANFNNVLPAAGAGFLNCSFAKDTVGDISLGCPLGSLPSTFAPGSGSTVYFPITGGTVTGPITLPANPVAPLQAAPKQYVDAAAASKADLVAGKVPTSELGTGTANAATVLFGDQTYKTLPPPGNFPFSVNGTSQSSANLSTTTPAVQTGYLAAVLRSDGLNVSAELPWGNTSSTFARGDLAAQFDAFGNLSVPATLKSLNIQTTGPGPYSVTGAYGPLSPPSAGKFMLYFGNGCPGTSGGDIQTYPAGSAFFVCYAHLDSFGNVVNNANTSTALAATPTNCNGVASYAYGISANGNALCNSSTYVQLPQIAAPSGVPSYGLLWFDNGGNVKANVNNAGAVTVGFTSLFQNGNGEVDQQLGATAQLFNIFHQYTSASNFDNLEVGWDATKSAYAIGAARDTTPSGVLYDVWLRMGTTYPFKLDTSSRLVPDANLTRQIGTKGGGAGLNSIFTGSVGAAANFNLHTKSATATGFVTLDLSSATYGGGQIDWCVEATDGTDFQNTCGTVGFAGVKKSATVTTNLGTVSNAATIASAGTLTATFDTTTTTTSFTVRITATTSLTETAMRVWYIVRNVSSGAVATYL